MAVSLETEDKAEPWFDDDWGQVTHQQRIVRRLLDQESLLEFPKKYVIVFPFNLFILALVSPSYKPRIDHS